MTGQMGSSAHGAGSSNRSLAEQGNRVADEVKTLGRVALDSASEAATQLREGGGELLQRGKDRAVKAKSDLDRVISANPMKSVLIALGIGAAIGFALRRRS